MRPTHGRSKGKGGQWWLVCGLTDHTMHLIKDHLKERNGIADPKEGHLWINERAYPLRQGQLNAMIKEAGRKPHVLFLSSRNRKGLSLRNILHYFACDEISMYCHHISMEFLY